MTQTTPANRAGRDAMETSMSASEKVRRQIKAGRKPKTRTLPSLFDAMKRLCDEADRGRSLMGKYGLNPDDIHLALIYRADGSIGSSPLPAPGQVGPFIGKFEQMNADFLGILWWQTGPDVDKIVPMWITEFADDRKAAIEMYMFKNALASAPTPQ